MATGANNPAVPTIAADPAMPTFHGRPLGRLSVEQVEAMIRSGLLTKHDRLELIEGVLVRKMTKGGRHSSGSGRCWRAIHAALPPGWHVRVEAPVRLPGRDSLPEPDVSVARGELEDYEEAAPGPGDLALVVEVSDSTLAADRAMAATYLGGGVPAYWVLNVRDRQLELYTTAGGPGAPAVLAEADSAELVLDGRVVGRVAVSELLPRRRDKAAE
jgi:Uma2 family endonuclease